MIGWWTPASGPRAVPRQRRLQRGAPGIAAAGAATLMLALGRPGRGPGPSAPACAVGAAADAAPAAARRVARHRQTSSGSPRRGGRRDAHGAEAPRSSSCSPGCASPTAAATRVGARGRRRSASAPAGAASALTGAVAIPQAAAWGASRSMSRVAGCARPRRRRRRLATHAFTRAQARCGQRRRWAPLVAPGLRVGRRVGCSSGGRSSPTRTRTCAGPWRPRLASQRARATEALRPPGRHPAGRRHTRPTRSRRRSTSGGRAGAWIGRDALSLAARARCEICARPERAPHRARRRVAAPGSPPPPPPADAGATRLDACARRASRQRPSARASRLPDGALGDACVAVPIFRAGGFAGASPPAWCRSRSCSPRSPAPRRSDFTLTAHRRRRRGLPQRRTPGSGQATAARRWARRAAASRSPATSSGRRRASRRRRRPEAAINTALPGERSVLRRRPPAIALAAPAVARCGSRSSSSAARASSVHTNRRLRLAVERRRQAELKLRGDGARARRKRVVGAHARRRLATASGAHSARRNEDACASSAPSSRTLALRVSPIATAPDAGRSVPSSKCRGQPRRSRRRRRSGSSAPERDRARMKGLVEKRAAPSPPTPRRTPRWSRVSLGALSHRNVVASCRPRDPSRPARASSWARCPWCRGRPVAPPPPVREPPRERAQARAARHPARSCAWTPKRSRPENGLGPRHEISRRLTTGAAFPARRGEAHLRASSLASPAAATSGGAGAWASRSAGASPSAIRGSIRAEGRPGEGATFLWRALPAGGAPTGAAELRDPAERRNARIGDGEAPERLAALAAPRGSRARAGVEAKEGGAVVRGARCRRRGARAGRRAAEGADGGGVPERDGSVQLYRVAVAASSLAMMVVQTAPSPTAPSHEADAWRAR